MTSDAEVRARLAGLPPASIPPEVRAAIMDRLAQESHVAEVLPLTAPHRRSLSGLLVAAAAAAIVMLVSVVSGGADGSQVVSAEPVVKAGAIYDPGPFAAQVRQRFTSTPPATSATGTFADSTTGIVACTDAIDAFGSVLAVDTGSYAGGPAVVIVSTYPGAGQYEEVWVVNPQCGVVDTAVIRHLLLDVHNSGAGASSG